MKNEQIRSVQIVLSIAKALVVLFVYHNFGKFSSLAFCYHL